MTRSVTADDLARELVSDREIALLDVREAGALWRVGTPLRAAHAPLDTLEDRVPVLVGRRSTPVVVLDDGGGAVASAAAAILAGLGYGDVRALAGGAAAWSASGRELYRTEVAFARAFGAFVGARRGTPVIAASELAALRDAGEEVIVLDARPVAEVEDHTLPGARSAPGAELVDRGLALATRLDATIVVTCAARTRGILGAQALLNAGVRNPVRVLAGGTMAWWQADEPLVAGATDALSQRADERERARAASALRERFGLDAPLTVAQWHALGAAERDRRAAYLLDVRTPAEYRGGTLAGARSAPSWELVPRAHDFVATSRAPLTLVDDAPGLRGLLTASWLRQMGWDDVAVVALAGGDALVVPAPAAAEPGRDGPARRPSLDGLTVLDLARSDVYAAGHLPDAWLCSRAQLVTAPRELPGAGPLLLTSPDGRLARRAAGPLRAATPREVRVLDGGTEAWAASGGALEPGDGRVVGRVDDVGPWPWLAEQRAAAFAAYLGWERDVLDQLARDETVPFRVF